MCWVCLRCVVLIACCFGGGFGCLVFGGGFVVLVYLWLLSVVSNGVVIACAYYSLIGEWGFCCFCLLRCSLVV